MSRIGPHRRNARHPLIVANRFVILVFVGYIVAKRQLRRYSSRNHWTKESPVPSSTIWSVFTKPWRSASVEQLGETVHAMGFDAVELPVRPGYQVQPEDVASGLPNAVRRLEASGVTVGSVAAGTDEAVFAACADAGVPIIRIMVPASPRGYAATDIEIRTSLDALVARAERYGVRIGIQPHHDDFISDSSELYALVKDYDPRVVGAIWDSAHDALARKRPEHGLERLWPWLVMANLKSAVFEREAGASAWGDPVWEPVFVESERGMAEWGRALAYLSEREFAGPVCLTAEYTDETDLVAKVTADLRRAKQLQQDAVASTAGAPR
jgi:sugar phosphate isomerase/epimerase